MDIAVNPGPLSGTVRAVPSKSAAHRAMICAALADTPTEIICDGTSKDIEATGACLAALESSGALLPCGESGSTLRFLLPIVGALGRKASFVLEGRLPERPLSPLYEELVRHGCKLSPQGTSPFTVEGQLMAGDYTLDGGVSSQFISGLLFALPLLGGDSTITLTGRVESLPYIGMTLEMLKTFGINVEYSNGVFMVGGRQRYRSPGTVKVEGDWSNAAFWLCAGAISGREITVTGLDADSKQGDRAVVEILARFGKDLRGIEIDAADIPDLVPILSVVAAAAKGETVIRGAGRLRDKESDRLAAVCDVLGTLGADVTETEDGLRIVGGKPLKGGTVSSWGDHRIAMSAATAAVLCAEPIVIQGAEAVNKSYPTFFEERRRLECPRYTDRK
jgi:3-phosphoshikimate 1-carboxyvinyltransferase